MRNLISFFIFILFACLGMWWYYSCNWCLGSKQDGSNIVKEQIDPEIEAKAKKAYEDSLALANGLYAIDIEDIDVFRYPENIQINNSNFDVYIPEGIKGFENKIANYLGQHQDQDLIIYGYETSTEREADTLTGISRANYIKDILVKTGGVNGDRIVTQAKLYDYDYDADGKYNGGILLNFHKIDESRLKEIEKGIANKTLYSSFGSKEFKADATLANYALELKTYLDKYPDKKVLITGHTDNVGDTKSNQFFGLKRAQNVRNYLASQGIPSEKFTAKSKGELSPIAPNDTEENRAKNRRIEIIVN
ncbi:Outer membrane protein OmpA [Aquimarina amphilecti]|uniref:Outer membrane protein OmpA n=1 Tax=Aquimarina amphilecti TaxID=1038014 RepID=A0A1H7GFX4_AQUAM|nr:OmpA family protein [Aquimarina amphilecti]SEK34675.1 Outer membrane protein OmpA [Aquimarina amphilecti]